VQRLNAPTSASDGRTALDRAMATSASDAVQMRVLLHCGANANLHVQRHYPGNPPEGHPTVHVLHAAIMDEDVRIVDVLLEYNADIHATDEAGNSALHLAIMLGKGDIVALLLTYGAAVHTPQGKYENAFDLARHVNLMIMEMLLEKHPEYKLRYKLRKTLAKDDCKCDPADECTCQDRIVPIEDPDA
jgi:ankyrin repeat protein